MTSDTARVQVRERGESSSSTPKSRPASLGHRPESAIPVDLAVFGAAQTLERRFPDPLWVRGELVEVREARRGRWFGTLRGRDCRVEVHVPPGIARKGPIPEAGATVLVQGEFRIWQRAGEFRIDAVSAVIATDSEGARAAARKAAEKMLRSEGIFDSPKRSLSAWPRSVAVVTSPRGAAIGDIRSVVRRRAPWVSVQPHDCVVQGPAAPSAIVNALLAAGQSDADLVILTRGGGATDTLEVFNDPVVVRQVARSRIPIIVAVGHERDRTLADVAADLSAPTPSAAAELAVPDREVLRREAVALRDRVERGLQRRLAFFRSETAESRTLMERRVDRTLSGIRAAVERLDPGSSRSRMGRLVSQQLTWADDRWARVDRAVDRYLTENRRGLDSVRLPKLVGRLQRILAAERSHLDRLWRGASALSPTQLLARGYTLVVGPESATVQSVSDLRPGMELKLILEDGTAAVVVEGVEMRPSHGRH